MYKTDRILIPTDFSPYSKDAVDYGVQMAKVLGSDIFLLHVYQEPFIVPSGPSVPITREVSQWLQDIQDQQINNLEDMAGGIRSQVKNVKVLFKMGVPFFEIVKAAEEIPIDLIVMGTHGRTGMSHFMMGSVAELVVRKSPCPVLTVKPLLLKK